MFITEKEDEHEKTIYRRTNYSGFERGRSGSFREGVMSRKKYAGLEVSEARRLKGLEQENAQLKKLLAESMLDNEALKVALNRKY